jgi:hypothetical protein
MRRLFVLAALALAFLPGKAQAAPDPLACTGYPEQRVFLEAQAWWYEPATLSDGGAMHTHSGTCFPYGKNLLGVVRFDVVSKLHNQPGANVEEVQISAHQNGLRQVIADVFPADDSCPTTDCAFTNTLSADVSTLAYSGLTNFSIKTTTRRTDGSKFQALNRWPAYVVNGMPATSDKVLDANSSGWYQASADSKIFGYDEAHLNSPVPLTCLSGSSWSIKVTTKGGVDAGLGDGGIPIASSLLTIDPSLHAIPENPGQVLYDSPGPLTNVSFSVPLGSLASGPHALVIAARAAEQPGITTPGRRLSGAFRIPFTRC